MICGAILVLKIWKPQIVWLKLENIYTKFNIMYVKTL